jgi:acyl-coenzyme A thioesterase PaaI-like protein
MTFARAVPFDKSLRERSERGAANWSVVTMTVVKMTVVMVPVVHGGHFCFQIV